MPVFEALFSKKILLSPRGLDRNEEVGEDLEEPIVMQEEILVDSGHSGLTYPLEDQIGSARWNGGIPQTLLAKKRTEVVPTRSIELRGVDNSKQKASGDLLDKVRKKHDRQKQTSPVRARPLANDSNVYHSVPTTPVSKPTMVHVPVSEFSATRMAIHPSIQSPNTKSKSNKKTASLSHFSSDNVLNIEIVRDSVQKESISTDDNFVFNLIQDMSTDSFDFDSDGSQEGDRFEIYKSKLVLPPEPLDVKVETKQLMEEELRTMKMARKKTAYPPDRTKVPMHQLDFFKRKSREVSTSNTTFEKRPKLGMSYNFSSDDSEDENTLGDNKKGKPLTLKLPSLDKQKKKRKTIRVVSPEKKEVKKSSEIQLSKIERFDEVLQDDSDYMYGNEDMGIVDDVIKAASARDASKIPKSKIPKKYHIVESSPIVTKDDYDKPTSYNSDKKSWETTVFPSNKPTSRMEVVQLARTFEIMLNEVQMQDCDDVQLLENEISVMEVISSEISRQICVQCSERGALLDKLTARFKQLINRSLVTSKEAVRKMEEMANKELEEKWRKWQQRNFKIRL